MNRITLFTTSYCSQCQIIKDIIKKNNINDKFDIINVDENPEYADKYNLVVVPALLDKTNNVVYCSDFSETQLLNFVKENENG